MTATMTGSLRGLITKFAEEVDHLSELSKTKKVGVGAKIDVALAERLADGAIAAGKTESSIIEECIATALDDVVRRYLRSREEAAAKFALPGGSRRSHGATPDREEEKPRVKGPRKN